MYNILTVFVFERKDDFYYCPSNEDKWSWKLEVFSTFKHFDQWAIKKNKIANIYRFRLYFCADRHSNFSLPSKCIEYLRRRKIYEKDETRSSGLNYKCSSVISWIDECTAHRQARARSQSLLQRSVNVCLARCIRTQALEWKWKFQSLNEAFIVWSLMLNLIRNICEIDHSPITCHHKKGSRRILKSVFLAHFDTILYILCAFHVRARTQPSTPTSFIVVR